MFSVGSLNFKAIATPGHTNNSVSIICEDKFFTGDFLFLDGAGRDDLPTGSYEEYFASIQKIKDLPDYLIVCPGHNYGDNNLASLHQVKKENPVLACNTLEKFIELTKPVVNPDSWMVNVVKLNNVGNTSLEAFEIPKTKSVCQRGASANKSVDDIPYIKAKELNSLLKADKKLLLVDVRTKEELVEIPTLEQAINIPLAELPTRMDEVSAHVGKDFILICKSGARAVRAAKMVKKLNVGKVFVLQGGVVEYTK